MLAVAVAVCLFAMLTGVYASFFLDSASGPTVILILTAMFICAFVRRNWQVRAHGAASQLALPSRAQLPLDP